MKLIIDRGSTEKGIYSVEYGVDFDVLIGVWKINLGAVLRETMVEVDKIITKSAELKWCVMYIKHPLLMKSYVQEDKPPNNFWITDEEKVFKNQLRSYFAIRLQHRKFDVDLYEIGRRLFT